jgi:hypothetical protein
MAIKMLGQFSIIPHLFNLTDLINEAVNMSDYTVTMLRQMLGKLNQEIVER